MIHFQWNNFLVRLLPILLFCTVSTAQGQDELRYSGPLRVGNFTGEADYTYKTVDGDTLLDGPFQMQRSSLQALLEKEDSSFLFKGSFQDGYPNGYWRFQFGEFESDSESEVIDYQYRVMVSGVQEETKGTIKAGKPNGQWIYVVNRIEDSDVAETLFKSTIEFDNGVPQKSFRIQNADSTLVGRFLRDGLAHDEWTLYSGSEIGALENWYFTNGRLTKILTRRAGDEAVLEVYPRAVDNPRTINLDKRYIQILQLNLPSPDSSRLASKGIPKLLSDNAFYYKKIDTILSELGKSAFLPKFKVKVAEFPLDSLESVRFDSIRSLYRTSREISESFLKDTQLNILKLSDREAGYLYSAIAALSKEYVRPLGRMVTYHQQDIMTFAPRDRLMRDIWPDGFPSKEIKLDAENAETDGRKSFIGPRADTFDFSGNSMTTVLQIARYAAQSLDSIQSVLSKRLASNKRQQEFIAIEEQMIRQVKSLDSLIDSVGNKIPEVYGKVLKNIKVVADARLSEYSGLKETQRKMDLGRGSVVCFGHLQKLAGAVIELPSQQKEIEERYITEIWNPFMAVLMNEAVKKRITSAYKELLLPYFLDSTTADLSCGNAQELARLMGGTYHRMIELREEDSAKLERKIRRERDPQTVLKLFNLQPMPQKTEQ